MDEIKSCSHEGLRPGCRLARDAIPEPDAAQQEANPTKAGRSGGQAGAQRTQNLVLIALVGWLVYGQKLDTAATVGMALIIAGVLVVNLLSDSAAH